MKFNQKDTQQIEHKGLTETDINAQIDIFKSGLPPVNLHSAATGGNGICKLTDAEKAQYAEYFDAKRDSICILKFIPASGAATRMFKTLFNFLESYDPKKESLNSFINRHKDTDLSVFLVGIEKLPFYDLVLMELKKYDSNFETYSNDKQKYLFVKSMLDENRLNYGFFPKGLLPFHKYKGHISTAFEEHLFESALYCSSKREAHLHFTISEKHNHIFDDEFKRIQSIVEKKTDTTFNISFSYQKDATDTISVTLQDEPFREDDGQLLFRPSGHGALLENLNELDADLIFIKNIDNVVVFKYEEEVAIYKKMLAGMLLEIQTEAFRHLKTLQSETVNSDDIDTIAEFLKNRLQVKINKEFDKFSSKYQIEYLIEKLDRPIRVCGMVKNEGEPGGGPFWVKDDTGTISLQIVESAQVDKKNKGQKEILKNATHFNPVDIVCGIKNYQGDKFDLKKFVDPKTSFITIKTKNGQELKALESPGLWNGSMAYWNSIFVEVPLITFNPVKTVTDLLKPTHQIK